MPSEHRHLLDLSNRVLLCACRACSLLFDRDAAGGGHYRLVPDRRLRLDGFELSDAVWDRLRIPVGIAFFHFDSRESRTMAHYPSPMGPTESLLGLEAWEAVEGANPVLATIEPDVEALLVNRSKGERRHWLVPIEDAYSLVAVVRTHWRGFSGGSEVWSQISRFFDELDRRAAPSGAVRRAQDDEAVAPTTAERG
jgi:hypothetical protein